MIEFILSDTERGVLQRLVERACADPLTRMIACADSIDTKALFRLRERFFAGKHVPKILDGVEL